MHDTMTQPGAAAELRDVSVTYPTPNGDVAALRDLSLDFPRGRSTAVIGRSGSGKSTLISTLALIRRPTSGEVFIDGTSTRDLSEADAAHVRGSRIGIVFQSFHLDPSLTALDNVLLPWVFARGGVRRMAAKARALDALERMGIPDLAARRPTDMSGGQRQRVAIARALSARPALLIADEPTGSLDEETAAGIAEALYSLPADTGTTVVVVTHDSEVSARADRTVSLIRGRLAETGAAHPGATA